MGAKISFQSENEFASREVRIGIVLLPGFTLLSYSALMDVLRHGCGWERRYPVKFRCKILGDMPVRSSCGIEISPAEPVINTAGLDYLVVLGGREATPLTGRARMIEGLRRADAGGTTLVGCGSGLFLLIDAGHFDGVASACDWYRGPDRELRFADVRPVAGKDLVIAGKRISCAGGSAALDLSAWLVRQHSGEAAAEIAGQSRTAPAPPAPGAANTQRPSGAPLDLRVCRALKLIEHNLGAPLRADRIANTIGLSKRQLERLFQRDTGVSIQQYSRNLRIGFGLWLLENTSRPVTTVALDSGFSDSSHFNRFFRAAYGVVPSEARRNGKGRAASELPQRWQTLFQDMCVRQITRSAPGMFSLSAP